MATTFSRRALAAALAASAVLVTTACGGGSDPEPAPSPAPAAASGGPPSRLIVAGDSLADVGTFGLKATVQNAANPSVGYPVYPELVGSALGTGRQCSFFSSSDGTAITTTFNTNPGCTNFAVGGAQVVNPVTRRGNDVPLSLEFQLESAVAANGGAWLPGDLILVDAGSNDAAGLADAFLDARGGGGDQAIFLALLHQQLDAPTITQALAQPDGESVAAGLYMQRVAQTFWNTVKADTLDKGATRVALVEVPDLTLTPRFRGIAANLSGTEGNAFQAALRQWVVGFNTELNRLAAGDARVVVVPYFADFSAQNTSPAASGLTNATQASCPPQGDFPACTDAALDASPPAGLAPGWWKTWFYSDNFHPSPRGHELLAASVNRSLARAGWLR